MAKSDDLRKTTPYQRPFPAKNPQGTTCDNPVEEDPAVERGERIATSKRIARSGKEQGDVPGATPQKP